MMNDERLRMRIVSVIGSATCTEKERTHAEAIGAGLAKHGIAIVCGGRGGVMEAVCRGAQLRGGLALGLLPSLDREEANPYVSLALPTGLGQARNVLVVAAGEAVIAIGGGYGTLSEIGFALKLGKPLIGLGTWEASRSDGSAAGIIEVGTPEEAVSACLKILGLTQL